MASRCRVNKRKKVCYDMSTSALASTPRFYTLCRGTWDWLSCWRYHCAAGNSQRLLWNGRRPDSLHFGSVKSNIEHLESSSGLARLFKTVLILEKELIPSNADSQIRKEEIKIGSMI